MIKVQRFILGSKTKISLLSFILIVTGFISHYAFNYELLTEITFIIASVIGVIPIAIQAYQSLRVKVISIDLLVTIAVIGAFIIANYEESAIVTFLFLFGSFLEQRTLNKTRKAIKELTEMAPSVANLLNSNGEFVEVDIDLVDVHDILLVRTGDKIPVDGIVIEGVGNINEASITGESLPVGKKEGTSVYAGTILENGTLKIRAEKVGEDTTFGKIIELVYEAQDSKSDAEKFIDKFAKYYTPIVLLLGILVFIIWRDIALAITVLVLGCPGALVIGVPVSNVAGIGNGAKNGVLLKGSEVISDFSKVDVMVFDKTGTLTYGTPVVSKVNNYGKRVEESLAYLKAIELESSHPLANAIVNYIEDVKEYKVTNTNVVKGMGIISEINQNVVYVGNKDLITTNNLELTSIMINDINTLEKLGNSIVIVALNKQVEMILGIKDEIRTEVKEELNLIKKMGVKELVVLSGDNQGSVNVVAEELGLTKAYGNMLPEDKQAYIKNLQSEGKIVAFIGDGVNDSPSLALANIGIAIGSGTDVAIETSDVVLINSNFKTLRHSLGLTKRIVSNMKQNIIIAVGVVIVLLVALLSTSWLDMRIGMLVHEASILVVILNGMRLLRYKLKGEMK
ncbi:MAG TPA: heavy metal translocating P-type ATPase [Haploplasma sp.]|nr:heavy metal translocating P-type ATPase [Haploplasma sp.]